MGLKFVLTVTVLLVLSDSPSILSAQGISPQRARELYIELQTTENCPNCNHQIPRANCYGWRGQPYYEPTDEVCCCNRRPGLSFKDLSVHWPSPFSLYLDHSCFGDVCRKTTNTTTFRFRDGLDHLANTHLLSPVRRDSGFGGPDCGPYGLLGESRRATVVMIDVPVSAPAIPHTKPPQGLLILNRAPPTWAMTTLGKCSPAGPSPFLARPTELRSSRRHPSSLR